MNGKHETKFLALEFASGSVKVVKMKEGSAGLELLEAHAISISSGNGASDLESAQKEAAQQLLSHEKLEDFRLYLSIIDPHVCFSEFVLPKIPQKELAETLKWKMKDDMPYSAEEAVLDYRLFEITENEKVKQYSTLVASLPRNVVDRFYHSLPVHPESFARAFVPFTISSLPKTFSISSSELIVVIDIGHSFTEIAFYSNSKLAFLREIAFGGAALSRSLTQPLMSERGNVALTLEEAEAVKKNEELLDATNQKLVAGKIEVSKLFALIRPELEELSREIVRSLDYYAQEHGNVETRVFLTGGSSHLKGLKQFLEQNLSIPVSLVDLTQDLIIPESLQKTDLDSYYRLISLILDRKSIEQSIFKTFSKSAERLAQSVSYFQAGVAIFVLFFILSGGMLWRYFQMIQKTSEVNRQIANLKSGFSESQKIQTIESQINRGMILASGILVSEPYWDEVFRELAHVFPDNVILTDVSYEDSVFLFNGKILSADKETSISKLLAVMEGPIFHKVTLVNTAQNKDFVSFTVRARTGKQ